MSTTPVLDLSPRFKETPLVASLRAASKRHGKAPAAQALEIIKLSRGQGKLAPDEYFYYGLYDDSRYSFAEKQAFIGKRLEPKLHLLTNNIQWFGVAHDKLIAYSLLGSLGFPIPETQAIYRRFADFPRLASLSEPAALSSYLRDSARYPVFSKPVTGIRSTGVASIDAYDRGADELILAFGRRISVDAFVEAVAPFAEEGYLFQERVYPHEEIARLWGSRIPTLRIVVLIDDNGPEIFRVVWKIPAGNNIADNFWREGNILAAVDPETGCIWRAIRGVGPDQTGIENHPDTAAAIRGVSVPMWPEVKNLCLRAACALPPLRMQAWDVAVSSNGPLLMEVNVGGDYNLPQLATGAGTLEPRFRAFLAYCADQRGLRKLWKKIGIAEAT